MKLYEGKTFDRGLNRRFRKRVETRDAIVWSLDDTNKLARVKVQGSDELILAHYPRNWQTLPSWCKRGNAVRIAHKGGIRGYMEVVGNGRAIPTPVIGEQLPTVETLYDGVLTGGSIWPVGDMSIRVGPTTYRIDGITYIMIADYVSLRQGIALDAILQPEGEKTLSIDALLEYADRAIVSLDALLSEGIILSLDAQLETTDLTGSIGMDAILQSDGYELTLDAAPSSPNGRYDLITINSGLVPSITKGTAASNPVMPAAPGSSVVIGHVMVPGDITSILTSYINALFDVRKAFEFGFALASGTGTINGSDQFEWSIGPATQTPYCSVTATVKDQYGWDLAGPYDMTFTLSGGTGDIATSPGGPWSSSVVKSTGTSSAIIYYRRDQTGSEISPAIQVSLTDGMLSILRIQLLNSTGDLIV